jgi:hypothetical protein
MSPLYHTVASGSPFLCRECLYESPSQYMYYLRLAHQPPNYRHFVRLAPAGSSGASRLTRNRSKRTLAHTLAQKLRSGG